jgi:hypothetical protein
VVGCENDLQTIVEPVLLDGQSHRGRRVGEPPRREDERLQRKTGPTQRPCLRHDDPRFAYRSPYASSIERRRSRCDEHGRPSPLPLASGNAGAAEATAVQAIRRRSWMRAVRWEQGPTCCFRRIRPEAHGRSTVQG